MVIVIVGMLDERQDALALIKSRIERKGHRVLLVDISIGTGGIVPSLKADVSCEEIVRLVGKTIEEMKKMLVEERDSAALVLGEGIKRKVLELHGAGELDAILAIGGMTGTLLSLPAMKALPFGLPKLLISSAAAMPAHASTLSEYFALRDITVMHTVVDTVGMNSFVEALATNGAHAIAGMAEKVNVSRKETKAAIAMTEFGFCDKGAHYIREMLEKEYEIVSFHAIGTGDRAALDFVAQRYFDAFIDLVPSSFGEYLLGGNRITGPDRFDAMMDLNMPYILTPCGFDLLSCGPVERRDRQDPLWIARGLAERKLFYQDAIRIFARTTADEMEQMARAVAEKLNRHAYKNMVKFLMPEKGFSALSAPGGPLHDPASDEAFTATVKTHLDPEIEVIEVDAGINSPEFAKAVVSALRGLTGPRTIISA
jgi:uncharacterized protein (UPF0261 family)